MGPCILFLAQFYMTFSNAKSFDDHGIRKINILILHASYFLEKVWLSCDKLFKLNMVHQQHYRYYSQLNHQ